MNKVSHDSETPAHGQQVIVACAFIHHDFDGVTKVYLPRRAATKKFYPNVFEVPGGHIDFGEDIIEGLKREVREELGQEIVVGEPFSAFTYVNEVKGAHAVEIAFFARFVDGAPEIQLNPEDHSEGRWFAEDQQDEYFANRQPDDDERLVIKRGFAILRGEKLRG